jgi:lysophospholipase L1-like esterase
MRNSILLYIILSFQTVMAQLPSYPFDLPQYSFINYNTNQFELTHNNPNYHDLFAKFDTLIKTGANQIKIVHLGGSHIQADIYTHRIRQELQSFYPGILGSRGFFFPYAIAKTNSPSNLWITYSGNWQTSKNTQPEPAFTLGLSGITSALTSQSGSLKIVAKYDTAQHYDFNRIKVFCNVSSTDNVPKLNPTHLVKDVIINKAGGYVQYNLNYYTDTLDLVIQQADSANEPFQLYGISLENDDPGVVYNAIGVNGAMLKSYLRCGLFNQHLRALDPDWVIISIGTNEGNTRSFDKEAYRNEYLELLDSIRLAAPGAAILLTVPNDSYLLKRFINSNTASIREIIFGIARSYGYGVWDFYTIMGGLNSAMSWYNNGLMNKDHIHFNKPGYLLKGDLFFNAFLNSWNDHLLNPLPIILPIAIGTIPQTPFPNPIHPLFCQ